MKRLVLLSIALFTWIGIASLPTQSGAQEASLNRGGCSALDKSKPPLFISFQSVDEKAWAGDKYVKGVLLRLNNNSNCTVTFSAAYGESPQVPPTAVMRNGRMVRQPDVKIGSVTNGQRVSFYYLMKYPDQGPWNIGGFGGDVLEIVYLNGGDYVLFSVPLKNFKKNGELLVPYRYEWDEGVASQVITKENGYTKRVETVEHYLRFASESLPSQLLK